MPRRSWFSVLGRFAVGVLSTAVMLPGSAAGAALTPALVMHPVISDFAFVSSSETPPTETQCFNATPIKRRCFTPQAIQAAYNLGPLYAAGRDGRGVTIAIVDSFGSDTIAHDLHVFDRAFGLQPMCGEEGVTCARGMPTFTRFALQGTPPTNAQPGGGPHQEDHTLWALEVSLDVEMAHAIAPMANILLVTTPTAETLGVQGFPDMMNAEQFVVDNHMASVISQSFASAEDAVSSFQSLQNLRHAYVTAARNGVTVLGSSGDGGTANGGGFSHVFGRPDYQDALPSGSTAIGTMRGVPDVGLQASARTGALVFISLPPDGSGGLLCGSSPCSTGWYDIGGTSLSCPQWAAMVAIADQINGGGLGLVNPALYRIGADPARYANDFFDVTTGNNQADPSVPGYAATTGWDPVTGLGTPNAANLIPDLVLAAHGG